MGTNISPYEVLIGFSTTLNLLGGCLFYFWNLKLSPTIKNLKEYNLIKLLITGIIWIEVYFMITFILWIKQNIEFSSCMTIFAILIIAILSKCLFFNFITFIALLYSHKLKNTI